MSLLSVARYHSLVGNEKSFVDTVLPGGAKENLKLVGRGSAENPRAPAIPGDHGYVLNWTKIPPGGGSRFHSHPTPEVFIVIEGSLTVYWHDTDEKHITLGPRDCVSVAGGVMRGFRNDTDAPVLMLAIVTGHTGGGAVVWDPKVLEEVARAGQHQVVPKAD